VQWFRRAADQGNASAQFYLGVMSAEGHGLPQDYAKAASWYRLAAEHGDPQAQYNLGLSYAEGEGVSLDMVSAHVWLNLAAARFLASDVRIRSATRARDLVASKMTPEQLAEAQRRAREWQAKPCVRHWCLTIAERVDGQQASSRDHRNLAWSIRRGRPGRDHGCRDQILGQ
jgi:TPR repeat protein